MNWSLVGDFQLGRPWWLLLLPVLFWLFWRKGKEGPGPALTHSSTNLLRKLSGVRTGGPGRVLRVLRLIALCTIVLALSRPRVPAGSLPDPRKGIDIVLACDVSKSMEATDFRVGSKRISRREALFNAISEFVDKRTNDRIGMIGFASEVYLLSPLTTDANWIKSVFNMVQLKYGTAIGDGLTAAVRMLDKEAEASRDAARSKVVILVTDGINTEGNSVESAGALARKSNVKVYCLEILSPTRVQAAGYKRSPLSAAATATGGQYFQASDSAALAQIYRQIDKMETHKFEGIRPTIYRELYPWLMAVAAALLVFEWVASQTFWMRLP